MQKSKESHKQTKIEINEKLRRKRIKSKRRKQGKQLSAVNYGRSKVCV